MLSGTFLGFTVASPVNLGAFTMVCSLIIVPVVSLITPKLKKADADRIFSCYDKRVVVQQREAITAGNDVVENDEEAPAKSVSSAASGKPSNSGKKNKKKKKK